jgi:cation diffusion facilitator CzcD-associated flavoprotein CzcO
VSDAGDVDVLVVGAGLSGIDAAYHLQTQLPALDVAIVESRDALGGTWDLFRYPGIRSDSDMFTLGFPFRPWPSPRGIGAGADILAYLRDTAAAYGIDRRIRYRHAIDRASWSSEHARWTIDGHDPHTGARRTLTARFLLLCTGYYHYDHGYTPELAGRDTFAGTIIHPQHWPADLDYTNRRVVVIGSGATAVTLVPALAERAAHVTMLQRSPTYVMARPAVSELDEWLWQRLPAPAAASVARWRSVALNMAFYQYCRRFPARAKKLLVDLAGAQLRDADAAAAHFTPRYKPWDERMCLAPDGDLFATIRSGRADVVTDHIDTFTRGGLRLRSGRELAADVVVTATGLRLRAFGGIALAVDGTPVVPSAVMTYKGMMCSDLPNLAFSAGYTNASWTLKCDLTSQFVCRLLARMAAGGHRAVTPRRVDASVRPVPVLDFTSGYVQRAVAELPHQGSAAPWRLYQNYALDLAMLRLAPLDDPALEWT